MTRNSAGVRRFARADLDPAAHVAMHYRLVARPEHGADLVRRVDAFCATFPEAHAHHRVDADFAVTVISIDGGELSSAVRGGPAAHRAVAIGMALLTQLFMFYPTLCPNPTELAAS